MLPPTFFHKQTEETPVPDALKPFAGFQTFVPSANATVLNKAEMVELKGGRRAQLPRLFTSYFSWNSSCGGPMPQ